jgi:general secretion pathway protein E
MTPAADAADALAQVVSMQVEPYLIGSALLGVVAQRTLRLNCPRCQEKDAVDREQVKELGIPEAMQPAAFFRGRGCEACLGTGFDRETSIFEVLEVNEEARARLSRDARADTLRSLLRSNGMMTLRQIAIHKAINGQTSLAEVLRTTA